MAREGCSAGKPLDVPVPLSKRRQTLEISLRTLILVAVLEPGFGRAQTPSAPLDELVRTLQGIEERDLDGSRSPELIAPLQTLALRYQENGEHELAAAAIERALEVVRMHYGLYSLEQAPLIQQSIDNEEARDNHAAVWALEQELLTLAGRNPDDLRTVHILRQIADKRMDALRRYIAGQYPPEIVLGCYYRYQRRNAPRDVCSSGSKGIAVRNLLLDARKYYEDAISVIDGHQLARGDELRELEMKIIRANYFYGDEQLAPSRYEQGKESLRRLVDYDKQNSAVLQQMDSLVQIADWDLMYSNYEPALEAYERVYERLKREGIAQESIDQLFLPDTPTVLPAFLPNPLVSEQTPQSTGFIDVAFEINRYGKARRVDILETTTNASKSATSDLSRLISQSRFRPRTQDGDFDGRSSVVLRYYLSE